MASLKDMRVRIAATKATQKITKAMQMVAASKLRRAQQAAEAARPFAERMDKVLGNIAASVAGLDTAPALLRGTGKDQVHLLIVCTAERGLCGAFNSSIVRLVRERITALTAAGKTFKILCVGRKGADQGIGVSSEPVKSALLMLLGHQETIPSNCAPATSHLHPFLKEFSLRLSLHRGRRPPVHPQQLPPQREVEDALGPAHPEGSRDQLADRGPWSRRGGGGDGPFLSSPPAPVRTLRNVGHVIASEPRDDLGVPRRSVSSEPCKNSQRQSTKAD
jgi:hypothetical protein